MKKNLKKIPKFKTEKQERNFWLKKDSTTYIDWSKTKSVSLLQQDLDKRKKGFIN